MESTILTLSILLTYITFLYILKYRDYESLKKVSSDLLLVAIELQEKNKKYTFLMSMLDKKTKNLFYNKYWYAKNKEGKCNGDS